MYDGGGEGKLCSALYHFYLEWLRNNCIKESIWEYVCIFSYIALCKDDIIMLAISLKMYMHSKINNYSCLVCTPLPGQRLY